MYLKAQKFLTSARSVETQEATTRSGAKTTRNRRFSPFIFLFCFCHSLSLWPLGLTSCSNSFANCSRIDAIILATTTPDAAMPSTACILQDRLCLPSIPSFDINAACSGWLYACRWPGNGTLSAWPATCLPWGRGHAVAAFGPVRPYRIFHFRRRGRGGDNLAEHLGITSARRCGFTAGHGAAATARLCRDPE